MNKIMQHYNKLLKKYGYQGWWPLLDLHKSKKGVQPTKTGFLRGYHPKDYSYPKTEKQRFEICISSILTQNTAWANVEKALINLEKIKAINPRVILSMDNKKIIQAIKPAGYFNQKAKKLKLFSEYYLSLEGKAPKREELLKVWGIGPETADSILLYAYKKPCFVVDAYTRRLFPKMKEWGYDKIKSYFERHLKKDYKIYQEYHALIVENAKRIRGI